MRKELRQTWGRDVRGLLQKGLENQWQGRQTAQALRVPHFCCVFAAGGSAVWVAGRQNIWQGKKLGAGLSWAARVLRNRNAGQNRPRL